MVIVKRENQNGGPAGEGPSRRDFFKISVGTVAGFAAGFAAAFYALPKSLWLGYLRIKLRRAEAPGPDVEASIQELRPGQSTIVSWKARTVLIQRRTDEMLKSIEAGGDLLSDPDSRWSTQPDGARNPYRSLRPDVFVVDLICTHLGCPVSEIARGQLKDFDFDGFFCFCHGSRFDLAGRVFKGVPAPLNLTVPPHRYKDANSIVIGSTDG